MKTSECCLALAKCPEQRISTHIKLRESKLTDQDVTKLLLAKLNFEFLIVKTGKTGILEGFPFPLCCFEVNEQVWRMRKDTYRLMLISQM